MGHLYDVTVENLKGKPSGEILRYALRREMEYRAALHTFQGRLIKLVNEIYQDFTDRVNVDFVSVNSINDLVGLSFFFEVRWLNGEFLRRLQDVASSEGFIIGSIGYEPAREGFFIDFCVNRDEVYVVGDA